MCNKKNDKEAAKLLKYLKERPENRLGYGNKSFVGKGFAGEYALKLYELIKNSKAVESGCVSDIFDSCIMIKGVNKDRLSDLIFNITIKYFIDYTQQQCKLNNIPMANIPDFGYCWNPEKFDWEKIENIELPIHDGKAIIFTPRAYAFKEYNYTYQKFYNEFMLKRYEENELANPSSGLVKILKDGRRKIIKEKLRLKYPCHKNDIINYIYENPEEYKKYKKPRIKE